MSHQHYSRWVTLASTAAVVTATLLILAGVWGLDFSRLVVLASSFFAVLGVAMVAQWSILSNITASITIFFAFPYKIGDRIRILDKDDTVTGVITEILCASLSSSTG